MEIELNKPYYVIFDNNHVEGFIATKKIEEVDEGGVYIHYDYNDVDGAFIGFDRRNSYGTLTPDKIDFFKDEDRIFETEGEAHSIIAINKAFELQDAIEKIKADIEWHKNKATELNNKEV